MKGIILAGEVALGYIVKNELGWEPKTNIDIGLKNTLNWYMNE